MRKSFTFLAVLVTAVMFNLGAEGCRNDPKPSPSPSCDLAAGECPMQTGRQDSLPCSVRGSCMR